MGSQETKNKKSIKTVIKQSIIAILAILFIWISASLMLFLSSDNLIFKNSYSKVKRSIKIPHNDIFINYGEDHEQTLYILKTKKQESEKIILFLHGNAGGVETFISDVGEQYNILAPSYPGYYASSGNPSEEGMYKAVDLSIRYLRELGYEDKNITIFGASLGASPALYAAKKYPDLEKVILVGAFDSIKSMCTDIYKIFCIFADPLFNNIRLAQSAKVKIRQFHSKEDEIVDYKKGRNLYENIASKDKKFYAMTGKHGEFLSLEIIKAD